MADRTPTEILESIDATLKELVGIARAKRGPEVATDHEMSGKFGDPKVAFVPRDWTGNKGLKGCNFSGCPPEFLDMLAETYDYFAQESERENKQYNGKPEAPFKRSLARKARGWAKRIRGGWKQTATVRPAAAESGHDGFDDAADPDFR